MLELTFLGNISDILKANRLFLVEYWVIFFEACDCSFGDAG